MRPTMVRTTTEKFSLHLTYLAFMVWSIFTFISFSLSAIGHLLIIFPGIFFTYKYSKEYFDNRPPFKIALSTWMLLGLTIVGIISVLLNTDTIKNPIYNIFKLKYFIITFLGIFACSRGFTTNYFSEKKIRALIHIFMITTALASFVGIIALYTGYNYLRFKNACHESRACGMFGMYMSYAYAMQFVVILQLGLIIHRKKLSKFFNRHILYISFVTNSAGLFLSYTRGAWIGVVVAIPFLLFFSNKKTMLLSILSIVTVVIAGFVFSPKIRDTFFSQIRITSNEIRISQYKAAIAVFKEKPFFGIGHRNFEPNVAAIKQKYNIEHQEFVGHGHSNFFEQLASTGLIGLIFLSLFHIFWFMEALRSPSELSAICLGMISALFISGHFQYTIGDGEVLFVIFAFYMLYTSWNQALK